MQRLALAAMCLVACGREASKESQGAPAAGAPSVSVAQLSPLDSQRRLSAVGSRVSADACPATGLWAVCSVIGRLDRAGLVPRRDSTATTTEPPLTATGALVRVGNAELQLYVYPDAAAREREQRLLDPSKYLKFDAPQTLKPLPTLISNANLLAVLHSRNDHLRERVSDAITAGPPQPPTPNR